MVLPLDVGHIAHHVLHGLGGGAIQVLDLVAGLYVQLSDALHRLVAAGFTVEGEIGRGHGHGVDGQDHAVFRQPERDGQDHDEEAEEEGHHAHQELIDAGGDVAHIDVHCLKAEIADSLHGFLEHFRVFTPDLRHNRLLLRLKFETLKRIRAAFFARITVYVGKFGEKNIWPGGFCYNLAERYICYAFHRRKTSKAFFKLRPEIHICYSIKYFTSFVTPLLTFLHICGIMVS